MAPLAWSPRDEGTVHRSARIPDRPNQCGPHLPRCLTALNQRAPRTQPLQEVLRLHPRPAADRPTSSNRCSTERRNSDRQPDIEVESVMCVAGMVRDRA